MSFFASDTKGDLARNYGAVAEKYYGYHVSVVDLRNPTRSDGYNLMTLINRYMDKALREHSIEAYGKAENLINILAHSIISPKGEESRGQNDYFYKAAEGVVASVLLLLAEFLPPDKDHPTERRHLVSVFILIQQLLAPSGVRGQSYFKQLMDMLPAHHRARNLASSALESSDQATASAMSTALAQMNTFMDIALEQVICFDNNVDAEKFAKEKTALFLILPEEDRTKNFMAGLMIQNLSKELFELAEKGSGACPTVSFSTVMSLAPCPPLTWRHCSARAAPVVSRWCLSSNRWRSSTRTTVTKARSRSSITARIRFSEALRPIAKRRRSSQKRWATARY